MNEEINQNSGQNFWQCPSCQAINDNQNKFCKNCGFNSDAQPTTKSNKSMFVLLALLVVLICVFYFGFSQYKKFQNDKKSEAYVKSQQVIFGDAIKSINGLGSEIDFADKYKDEKNADLIVQKMNDEKYKSAQAADVVLKAKNSQSETVSTPETEGLKFLMTSFYDDASVITKKYDEFMLFQYEEAKINAELDKEREQFDKKFVGEFKTDDDVVVYFNALAGVIDKIVSSYETLDTPEGMGDYMKPMETLRELSLKIKDFTDAINKKDFKKANTISAEIKSALSVVETAMEKSNEVSKNYYTQMHDEFVSLRGKADKIKSEIVLMDVEMRIQPLEFSIEGW